MWQSSSNFYFYLFIFLASTLSILLLNRWKSNHRKLPPGPPGWPIIGNLLDLGNAPHRALANMKNKYGDVLFIRLGAINTMVIGSTKAATELFKNHDLAFVDRKLTETSYVHDYHKGSVAMAPYGSYWRVMRRLFTTEMTVVRRLNESAPVRRKCVDRMLAWIEEEAREKSGQPIHVAYFVFLMSFNLLGNMMMSRDLVDPKSTDGSDFYEATMAAALNAGTTNMADLFPWLRWLDPQGLVRKQRVVLGKALEIASKFMKERIEERESTIREDGRKDFLDLLLEFKGNGKDEPEKFSDNEINIFTLELFFAGGETSSTSTEWAMTELLRHPHVMRKAKAELDVVVGPNRKVEESDIDNLPYLNAVVKETFRLHPPVPLLVPRNTVKDNTTFMGYDIPKNTQVFVNAWAIGRDSGVWEEPESFKPERFLETGVKTDYKGQNFKLIPFGAGRRICAGLPLAHRVVHLVLGSLIHHFDWELESGVTKETMNMEETLGITMRKVKPLLAIPKTNATM